MVKLKGILFVKWLVFFLVFCLFHGDLSIYGENEDYRDRFKLAIVDYQGKNYQRAIETLENIHRMGRLTGELNEEDNDFLSQVHLLLAASYEQTEHFIEACENYRKALDYSDNPLIPDIDFSSLNEYQRLILKKDLSPRVDKRVIEKTMKKKKKKFPWLLVAGGIVAVTVALLLILKKKDGEAAADPDFDTTELGIDWVNIPAGEFLMGDNFNEGEDNQRPVHTVYLDEYRISKFEVTFEQYDRFCEETNRSLPDDKGWGRGNQPVFYVSWNDAQAFCEWLSEKTGKNIHLPTEAQWEKAARGTDQRRFPWGDSAPDCGLTNFYGCALKTLPVGSHPAGVSPFGIHDLAGNVGEWCQDWFGNEYYSVSPVENPRGPDEGETKIHRGGGWVNSTPRIRSARRSSLFPDESNNYIGFRICWE